MQYWGIVADKLSAAGWSWGYCAAVTRDGWRWIVDAVLDRKSLVLPLLNCDPAAKQHRTDSEREGENFNHALFALAFFSRQQDRELLGAISVSEFVRKALAPAR